MMFAFVTAFALAVFWVRLLGASTLMDKDQERPAAYVLDILQNGHWLCPQDWSGDLASKPPLSVWIAALVSRLLGKVTLFTLLVPSILGIGGAAVMITWWGQRSWGLREGFLAGTIFLACPLSIKLIALNRTDGLFTLGVLLTAATAYRAMKTGRGWYWFWLAGIVTTLTKGPLGVVLGTVGWLAQRRPANHKIGPGNGKPFATGLAVYCIVTLGWLLAAIHEMGPGVARKMLGGELAAHALDPAYGFPGRGIFTTPIYFVSRFLPWSVLSLAAAVRILWISRSDARVSNLERFLACWLVGGLVPFALATHQRGDLVAPLLPPAALLGGRELARWTRGLSERFLWIGSLILAAGVLIGTSVGYRIAAKNIVVQRSEGMRQLAETVRTSMGPNQQVQIVDAPFALQLHLNQFQTPISYETAAQLLETGSGAAVAVLDLPRLISLLTPTRAASVETIARWPSSGVPWIQVVRLNREASATDGPYQGPRETTEGTTGVDVGRTGAL
jgi:4-amino-4-deoxy-L-arabinose transferase-like glycosyltransferase